MIFAGAGASYDSDLERAKKEENRPGKVYRIIDKHRKARIPMADDLFAQRFTRQHPQYWQVRSLAKGIMASRHKTTVENYLGDYAERMKGDAIGMSHLMAARYFIQEVIGTQEKAWHSDSQDGNNWSSLLVDLRRRGMNLTTDVTFVTTNYDRLIETALRLDSRMEYSDIEHYTREDRTNVLKLHGSVDWALYDESRRHPPQHCNAQWIIENALSVDEPRAFRYCPYPIHEHRVVQRSIPEGQLVIPAIAIPVRNKTDYMCPPEMRDRFKERLAMTTHLLVIGWRGDPHITELMAGHLTKLVYPLFVGPDTEQLQGCARAVAPRHVDTPNALYAPIGFSDFVRRSEQLERFLNLLSSTL
jgi:hypothetical protein